jgi:hypothetical protein
LIQWIECWSRPQRRAASLLRADQNRRGSTTSLVLGSSAMPCTCPQKKLNQFSMRRLIAAARTSQSSNGV